MSSPQRWAVLPARWASTRLPGKVLADLGGRSMLEQVWRRVVASGCFDRVLIATDHPRVLEAALGFGAEAVLTGPQPSGTHRVARVTPPDVAVVNVQADQPLLDPAHLVRLVELVGQAPVATLCAPLLGDPCDPAVVKVTVRDGRAVAFSRRPLPAARVHVGLYAFAPGQVHRCAAVPRSARAREEDLEQLAWMDAGVAIAVGEVDRCGPAVDTPAQLAAVREELTSGSC